MELQQLKTFVTIARVGNFTKAAELLDYAQSSVSAQIKALETDLQTRLFERLGREVCLTEDGLRLLDYAEQLLKLAEETRESVSGNIIPKGTLTIGAPETLCIYRLPAIFEEYRRRYPLVKLVLKLGSCQEITEWLQKNLIDLAFFLGTPLQNSNCIIERLSEEPIVMIAGKAHPLIESNPIASSDLKNADFLLMEEEGCCYRVLLEQQLSQSGVQLKSVQELGSVEMIKKCVISNLGISILPRISVVKELQDGLLYDLHWDCPEPNIFTQMLHRKDKWLSPALSAMIQLTKIVFEQFHSPT